MKEKSYAQTRSLMRNYLVFGSVLSRLASAKLAGVSPAAGLQLLYL